MIRFQCPTCKFVLQSPGQTAGDKVACPKCGQRLLVPNPVKPAAGNKTVLGQSLPILPSDWLNDVRAAEEKPYNSDVPYAELGERGASGHPPRRPDGGFDTDPPESRRRRTDHGQRSGLGALTMTGSIILFGIIGALIGCAGLAFIGLVLSQYWPVFGGILERNLAEPWSPARESLIPIHLLVFGILGLVLGGGLGAVFGFLVGTQFLLGNRRRSKAG